MMIREQFSMRIGSNGVTDIALSVSTTYPALPGQLVQSTFAALTELRTYANVLFAQKGTPILQRSLSKCNPMVMICTLGTFL
jgi:hypothetical protein